MEFWDIYDGSKQPTGRTMKRNDWCLQDGEYHLTVLGVIAHKDGRFLITKRVMTKAWAPGWWEVSGGAAMAGETSEQAVRREVREETGLDVTGWDGGYMFSYKRENPGEGDNYFVDIYRFVGDFSEDDLAMQDKEIDGYMLATLDEIKAFAQEGIFLHYDSIKQVFEQPLDRTGANRAVCRDIVRKAGERIRNAVSFTVEEKSSFRDLVTSCDKETQDYLVEQLHAVCPSAGFLCEEGESHAVTEGYQFIIDPIDGTTNFVHQFQYSAIAVAFATKEEVLWGIAYNPFTDELFEAERGLGAFLNGKPIHVSDKPLAQSLVLFGTSPYRSDLKDATMTLTNCMMDYCLDIRRNGASVLDLCYVAAGRAGAYYEMNLAPWDFAASMCIAQEAGAVVTTFDGKPVVLTQKGGILAGNPTAYEECLALIHDTL